MTQKIPTERVPVTSWRQLGKALLMLTTVLIVLTIIVSVGVTVVRAVVEYRPIPDAPGRPYEPSGVADVLTACADQGIRLFWDTEREAFTAAADPSCRAAS
jgi:hypothetical protein